MTGNNPRSKFFVRILEAAALAGFLAILGLIIGVIQIGQTERDSREDSIANATLVAVLESQLNTQREMATVQAAASNPDANATLAAQRLSELEYEFEVLEMTRIALESASTEFNSSINSAGTPSILPTSTPKTSNTNVETDPTIYDSFDDTALDGTINSNLWDYWDDSYPHLFSQQGGLLRLNGEDHTALIARKHIDLLVRTPTFYEARLMLNDADAGSITLKLHGQLPNDEWWATQCGIYAPAANAAAWAFCDYGYRNASGSYTDGEDVELNSWHIFRIEINPEQQTVTYFIDGESKGNILLPEMANARFSLVIGGFTASGTTIGYVDEVRYGPLE